MRRFGLGLMVLFTAAPAMAFDPTSPYGVTAFIPSPSRWQSMQDAMIVWNRCEFSWRNVETSQNVFNWTQTDEMVNEANARGLQIYAGLGYTPTWASSGGQTYSPPLNSADWADYLTQVVNRYKNSIHVWELWNEPNLSQFWGGTRQQYIDNILKVGADAIHAADPTAKVAAPEISRCCSGNTWMTDVLNQAGAKIDIIAHHQYDYVSPQSRLSAATLSIDQLHNLIVSLGYGNKPIWCTESGWASDEPGLNETLQGQYLVEMLKGMETRPWLQNFMWYQIWEGPSDLFGLVRQDESRKPVWYAYRDFVFASNWGPQTPFGGTARAVPGMIQAEDFDSGGPGVGYGDSDPNNNGGQYRTGEQVDIEGCGDTGGGFNVGFTAPGEFLKYTINVASTGNYDIQLRVAAPSSPSGTYHLQARGINKTGVLTIPVTGGWQTYQTTTVSNVSLTAGTQVLKVYIDSGGFNLNWINIVTAGTGPQTPFGGTARAIPGVIQAEDYDLGGEDTAYNDNDGGNNGAAYRSDNVDIEATTDTGGGYNVGWTGAGEWLEYTVNVNTTGDYAIKTRLATGSAGGTFHYSLNDTNITAAKTIASTGGWQTWTTIIVPGIAMTAGTNKILRFTVDSGDFNFNNCEFTFGGADVVSVDLGSTNIDDGMTSPVGGDGDTVSATIGGHNCRKSMDPNFNDWYFYFTVADIYAFQGNKNNAAITVDYYDTGTQTIRLDYDGASNPYTQGQTIALTNTNTWKTHTFNVSDAYFGNRQNNASDFRIANAGSGHTIYLDTVMVFSSVGGGPVTLNNSAFPSNADGWNVVVWRAGQYTDGTMAWLSTNGNPTGNMRSTGSGTSNNTDSCTREGGEINKAVSTAGYNTLVQVVYDVRFETNQTGTTCVGSCPVLEGNCADKLAVYYSTAGTAGPWTLLEAVNALSVTQNVWSTRTINCPAAANNKPNFAVRFRWQFNQSSDGGRLDNVKVIATP